MGYKIGIYDKDINYIRSVMEYINHYGSSSIRMAAFSSVSALEDYTKENYLDLIILGEQVKIDNDIPVVFLCDKREMLSETTIYKYQSGDAILCRILDIIKNSNSINLNNKLICGVYSPLGRCGKTTLSLGLCNHHKKSIYIGLEQLSGMRNSLCYSKEIGEKFVYYLANRDEGIIQLLKETKDNKEGFKSIVSDTFCDDIIQLSFENMDWFCRIMRNSMEYFRMVFDLSVECLGDVKILSAFDRVYMPVIDDPVSKIKLEKFQNMLDYRDLSDLRKKIVNVEVPDCEYNDDKISLLIKKGDL